jgi:hypothetical protein
LPQVKQRTGMIIFAAAAAAAVEWIALEDDATVYIWMGAGAACRVRK